MLCCRRAGRGAFSEYRQSAVELLRPVEEFVAFTGTRIAGLMPTSVASESLVGRRLQVVAQHRFQLAGMALQESVFCKTSYFEMTSTRWSWVVGVDDELGVNGR